MLRLPSLVTIRIAAIDAATSVIKGVQSAVGGLTSMGKSAIGSGLGASLLGNLGATAITSTLGLVSQGFDSVKGSIMEATQAQTSFITASAALATGLDVPISKAKSVMEGLQIELSKAAASLPGENRDYIAVLNQLSDTVATQFRGDTEGFKAMALDITKRTAALASTVPGLSGEAAGMTMEQLINGNTLTALKRLDLFQKNPQLKNALQKEMEAAGLEEKKWTKATTKQRLEVIQKALKVAATDDLFAEFENTAESIMQGMKSKLFDMQTGIFGVMRKVDTRQGRNALDAFTEVLKRIRTLGAAGGRLGAALGLAIDPMEGLIDLFDGINLLLGNITYSLDISKPQDALNNVASTVATFLSDTVGKAISGIKTLDTGAMGKFADMLNSFVVNIDWMAVGRFVGIAIYKLAINIIKAIPALGKLGGNLITGLAVAAVGVIVGLFEGIGADLYRVFVDPISRFFEKVKSWFMKLKSFIPNISNPMQAVASVGSKVLDAVPGGGLIKEGLKAGANLLGIGKDKDGKPLTTGNPNADKVNGDNKVTPVTPVSPKTQTPIKTAMNTIGSININATTPQDAQGVANVVIEELERRLGFRQAQSIG